LRKLLSSRANLAAFVFIGIACGALAFALAQYYQERQTKEGDIPTAVTLDRISHLFILCESYRDKTGSWPASISTLTNIVSLDSTNDLDDGWGRQMLLISATNSPRSMILISYGADGIPGGAGTNGDISYLLK
jgi:hypothetical protein